MNKLIRPHMKAIQQNLYKKGEKEKIVETRNFYEK